MAEVGHVQAHLPGFPAHRQLGERLEVRVAGALVDAALEGDGRVVLDVEEVGVAQVLVPVRFARPELGRVHLALEGRSQRMGVVDRISRDSGLDVDGYLARMQKGQAGVLRS